jgi:RES domain-containing protein
LHRFEQLLGAVENIALSSYSGCVYRLIPYKYRNSLLSVAGAVMIGGRYNPPNEFGVLYTCDTQLTANLEVQALFVDKNGRLAGAPRNPDLMLTLSCELRRVIDLRQGTIQEALGTAGDELISNIPSRHVLNPKGQFTPTQILGKACYVSGRVSALIAPSAANTDGFCLGIFPDRLIKGERLAILDSEGSLMETLVGET